MKNPIVMLKKTEAADKKAHRLELRLEIDLRASFKCD